MNKYRETLEQVIKDFPEDWMRKDLSCDEVRYYIEHKMKHLDCEVKVLHLPGFEGDWVIPKEDMPGMYITISDKDYPTTVSIIGGEK